jgi:ketosteroid isomerase-like protein
MTTEQRRERTHATFDRLQAALLAHDMDAFANDWAPDGTMTFPFAPPGWPQLTGREAIHEYLAGFTDSVDIHGIRHQTRYDTSNPDTILVEWGVAGVALSSGRPYDIDYVAIVTVGAEGITAYRDYWSPLAAGTALGGLDEMIAAFTEGRKA